MIENTYRILLHSEVTAQHLDLGLFQAENPGAAEDKARKKHKRLLRNLVTNTWTIEVRKA